MARKKFRNSPRSESVSSRSFQEYILNTPAPQTSRTELVRLIRGGEDTYLELKVKLSNAERITQEIVALANTAGGVIIFGVNDQLRIEGVDYPETVQAELARICREEIYPPLLPLIDVIAFDNGRRVVALDVEGKRRPYRTAADGRYYLRIGAEKREATREELSVWLEEIRPLAYENIAIQNAAENDIDDALLWSFAKNFEADLDLKISYNTKEFLKKDLLLAVNGGAEEFIPTIAALLLFGKNEVVSKFVPRSGLTLIRYGGDKIDAPVIEKTEIEGNLLMLYESAIKFVKLYCDLWDEKPRSFSRDENEPVQARANYKQDVIGEAIANALIHRDLVLRDLQTRILIFDSFVEIINPRRTGGFTPPASRAIRYGITQRLNPQIASIFSNEAYEANLPHSTLPKLLRDARLFANRRAEIYTSGDEFKLKIYGI